MTPRVHFLSNKTLFIELESISEVGRVIVGEYNSKKRKFFYENDEPNWGEWCTGCKEYDREHHCCPRWNNVIRDTVSELKEAYSIVQCWECKYRPIWNDERGKAEAPPKENPEYEGECDMTCPYLCDDSYYNRMPQEWFFCAKGERK